MIFAMISLLMSSVFGATFRTEPWLTETSISFLEEFFKKNPEAKVLEFGSGASTLWIAKRTPNLYSVEHSEKFYDLISERLKSGEYHNVNYVLAKRPYYDQCDEFSDEFFDLIIVDGRNRKGCIVRSIPKLKSGGVLLLDNAERKYYHSVFSLMKDWEYVTTEQTCPDKFGFWYRGWKTDWWIKP